MPTDHAFQRWHPIDWGFYPFSVPEFTECIIKNHFVHGRLKQEMISDGQIIKTLGNQEIVFKKTRRYFQIITKTTQILIQRIYLRNSIFHNYLFYEIDHSGLE